MNYNANNLRNFPDTSDSDLDDESWVWDNENTKLVEIIKNEVSDNITTEDHRPARDDVEILARSMKNGGGKYNTKPTSTAQHS